MTAPSSTSGRLLGRGRRALLLGAAALATGACGLQQAGVDGVVTAGPAGLAPAGGQATATPGQPGVALPGQPGSSPLPGAPGGSSVGGAPVTGGAPVSGGTGSGGHTPVAVGSKAPQTPGLKGELVVSYVAVSGFDQLGQVFVVNTATTGDPVAQTNALADYVNSHGGIGGRKLVPKVHSYNAQQASEVNDNNLCKEITDTDKAFLAVLHGQIHATARDCYTAKKTLFFEGSAYGFGKSFYDAHQPYMWSPTYADYDQAARALLVHVKATKWLAGETKAGVVLWDDKPYHDIVDRTLAPGLKQLGVSLVKGAVSNSDIGSIENGLHAAAQTMVTQQVDHLFFVGSAPLQPFFVQQNQQYSQFRYALTSFDAPRYMALEFPRNMVGSIGIGFSPVDDVVDAQYRFPQPGLEAECLAIYKKAGVPIGGRYVDGVFNSKQAMSYCESTLLLKKVADTLPQAMSAAAWTAAAERLGTSFQAAQTFRTSFGASKHTGAAAYRDIVFREDCDCMTYTSGNKALP